MDTTFEWCYLFALMVLRLSTTGADVVNWVVEEPEIINTRIYITMNSQRMIRTCKKYYPILKNQSFVPSSSKNSRIRRCFRDSWPPLHIMTHPFFDGNELVLTLLLYKNGNCYENRPWNGNFKKIDATL